MVFDSFSVLEMVFISRIDHKFSVVRFGPGWIDLSLICRQWRLLFYQCNPDDSSSKNDVTIPPPRTTLRSPPSMAYIYDFSHRFFKMDDSLSQTIQRSSSSIHNYHRSGFTAHRSITPHRLSLSFCQYHDYKCLFVVSLFLEIVARSIPSELLKVKFW